MLARFNFLISQFLYPSALKIFYFIEQYLVMSKPMDTEQKNSCSNFMMQEQLYLIN